MSRGRYWFAPRPPGTEHGYPVLVFDRQDHLHLPLTVFAKEAHQRLSHGAARTYLHAILPFFTYLDEWQASADATWDAPPARVRQAVGAYLMQHLSCIVRQHRLGFQIVTPTSGTRSTLRVFLTGLKLFYRVMQEQGSYPLSNPLLDSVSISTATTMEHLDAGEFPRMPDRSGVEDPRPTRRLSDSYFKLVGDAWVPQVVDDATLPAKVLAGGYRLARWGLREECVTRILFESGGRVSEVTGLTLGDWVARGLLQEMQASSKGSGGRRVKFLRFSSDTAKLLRRYFDQELRVLDAQGYTLEDYLERARRKEIDLHQVPLFLSAQRTPLSAKTYREHAWNPACQTAGIDSDIHQARHWYVTMAVRQIYETAQTDGEVQRRLRELIDYMHWKRGWETIEAYQHYFDAARHAEVQDGIFARLDQALQQAREERAHQPPGAAHQGVSAGGPFNPPTVPADAEFEYLRTIGGSSSDD